MCKKLANLFPGHATWWGRPSPFWNIIVIQLRKSFLMVAVMCDTCCRSLLPAESNFSTAADWRLASSVLSVILNRHDCMTILKPPARIKFQTIWIRNYLEWLKNTSGGPTRVDKHTNLSKFSGQIKPLAAIRIYDISGPHHWLQHQMISLGFNFSDIEHLVLHTTVSCRHADN